MKRPIKATVIGGGLEKAVSLQDVDDFLDWLVDGGDGTGPQDLYKAVAWSYWCANLRADNVAQIPYLVFPLEVEEDEDGKEVEFGLDLRRTLWNVEMWLVLKAAAYVYKSMQRKALDKLRVLNANTMSVKTWNDDGPTSFEQRVGTERRIFPAEDILYFRTFDPSDDIREGIAAASVGQPPGALVKSANEWATAFFSNGAIPAVLLTTAEAVPQVEKERVQSAWQKMFQGVQRAFRTAVLERGLTPTVIGQPVKDLAMPELEQTKRHQILAAHKIPPGYADSKTNRAEQEIMQSRFWNECIIPEVEVWIEPVLNESLFNPLGLRISFQYREIEVLQREEIAKAESAAFFVTGVMLPAYKENTVSTDEVRAVITRILEAADLPPLEENFEPEERTPPQLQPFTGEQQQGENGTADAGPGAPTPMDERIESRTGKGTESVPPFVVPPSWGDLKISLPN